MQDVRWLFFDLGNTLISEEAATDCRIRQLGSSFEQHGRRYSLEEVRCALQKASAEFAPRLITGAIEKLTANPSDAVVPLRNRGDRESVRWHAGTTDEVGANAVYLDLPLLHGGGP